MKLMVIGYSLSLDSKGQVVAKITKTILQEKIYQVRQAQGNLPPCVNDRERNQAKTYIRKVGLELIHMLDGDLTKLALTLVSKAEAVVDYNVKLLED